MSDADLLNGLASYVQPLCTTFLQRAEDAGIPCRLIATLRTTAQEQADIVAGVSWVHSPNMSKHTPQTPENKAEAFDVCPIELLVAPGWDPESELWVELGAIGRDLGLEWGGEWTHINSGLGDRPHFQYVHPTAMGVEESTG